MYKLGEPKRFQRCFLNKCIYFLPVGILSLKILMMDLTVSKEI